MKNIYYFIIYISLSITACEPSKLEQALSLAGDNRPELEKVLRHYSRSPADSLKLKAAMFLIENMPGHYTVTGGKVDLSRAKIDQDTTASYLLKKILDIAICHVDGIYHGTREQEDVRYIKADFLIRHIDRSFEKRERFPWASELPFEYFLEYVLPYRFENERLDLWVDSLQISPETLERILAADNNRYTLWNINPNLSVPGDEMLSSHPLVMNVLHHSIPSDCKDWATQILLQNRVAALPASINFFPNYANRNGYHYWTHGHSPEFRNSDVSNALERRSAKVYRKTYSIQPRVHPVKGEYIPEFFLDPFQKDVTDEYFHTAEIEITPRVAPRERPRYAYLFTFSNLTWLPSAIGEYDPNKMHFSKVGKNIVYLPGCYQARSIKNLHYPFILHVDGTITYLEPDMTKMIRARLERKYPSNEELFNYNKQLHTTTVQASNTIKQESFTCIVSQVKTRQACTECFINDKEPYRYWQIALPMRCACAEIIFYDNHGKLIRGKIDKQFEKVYDGDPLTNQPSNMGQPLHVTFDFDSPVSISRIILYPRSDGNGIYPGDEYELFYHDIEGWKSLGKRTATDYFLEYDNLPNGALYWLHNHTQGVEERPFTITKEGKVRFW